MLAQILKDIVINCSSDCPVIIAGLFQVLRFLMPSSQSLTKNSAIRKHATERKIIPKHNPNHS